MTWKVLSVRQPWAWLLGQGIKGVENRSWPTRYRGPVLIQAGLQPAPVPQRRAAWRLAREMGFELPREEDWARGGIVAAAYLADVVMDAEEVTEGQIRAARQAGTARVYRAAEWAGRSEVAAWFFGPFGFVLEKATPVPFEALPGQLGLFDAEYGGRCCLGPGRLKGDSGWEWCAVCGRVKRFDTDALRALPAERDAGGRP